MGTRKEGPDGPSGLGISRSGVKGLPCPPLLCPPGRDGCWTAPPKARGDHSQEGDPSTVMAPEMGASGSFSLQAEQSLG